MTVTTDVIGVPELVMNALLPLITHSSLAASYSALVRVPPASLPASGSVRPNAPRDVPATSAGRYSAFCSAVPNEWIGLAPRPTAAEIVMPRLWLT